VRSSFLSAAMRASRTRARSASGLRGARVTTFESGQAAIDWLTEHGDEPIDLLVTDQNMPGLSGLEVARAALARRPALPVAIVSGHVNEALMAEAATLGVREVLPKQDNMDALGQAIGALLESADRGRLTA